MNAMLFFTTLYGYKYLTPKVVFVEVNTSGVIMFDIRTGGPSVPLLSFGSVVKVSFIIIYVQINMLKYQF